MIKTQQTKVCREQAILDRLKAIRFSSPASSKGQTYRGRKRDVSALEKIIAALSDGPKTHQEIRKATGLNSATVYNRLNSTHADYFVRSKEGSDPFVYSLKNDAPDNDAASAA